MVQLQDASFGLFTKDVCLTSVMSLEAAAALIWRLGWRIELLQSKARANVPTALQHTPTGFTITDLSML